MIITIISGLLHQMTKKNNNNIRSAPSDDNDNNNRNNDNSDNNNNHNKNIRSAPSDVIDQLTSLPVTVNRHHWCLTRENFTKLAFIICKDIDKDKCKDNQTFDLRPWTGSVWTPSGTFCRRTRIQTAFAFFLLSRQKITPSMPFRYC